MNDIWHFPLKNYKYNLPLAKDKHPGSFLYERKYHYHEGIDLYANKNDLVMAVEDSIVTQIFNFTGSQVGSPWWNNTQAVVLKGKSGYVLYGEVEPIKNLKINQIIQKGETIAKVIPVLKKKKNNPINMLHLELYLKDPKNQSIDLDKKYIKNLTDLKQKIKKFELQDPTGYLIKSLSLR